MSSGETTKTGEGIDSSLKRSLETSVRPSQSRLKKLSVAAATLATALSLAGASDAAPNKPGESVYVPSAEQGLKATTEETMRYMARTSLALATEYPSEARSISLNPGIVEVQLNTRIGPDIYFTDTIMRTDPGSNKPNPNQVLFVGNMTGITTAEAPRPTENYTDVIMMSAPGAAKYIGKTIFEKSPGMSKGWSDYEILFSAPPSGSDKNVVPIRIFNTADPTEHAAGPVISNPQAIAFKIGVDAGASEHADSLALRAVALSSGTED